QIYVGALRGLGLRPKTDDEGEGARPAIAAALQAAQSRIADQPWGQAPDSRVRELLEPLVHLADDIPPGATALTPDQQVRKMLAVLFTELPSPGVAINAASSTLMTLVAKAQRLQTEAGAAPEAETRNRLRVELADAEQKAEALAHHLQ